MGRPAGHPDQDLRNVFRRQRSHSRIDVPGLFAVALEADHGKFGFRQAGIHGADPDAGPEQFVAQHPGDGQFAGLGRAIGRGSGIGGAAGNRSNVEDARPGIPGQQRQSRARDSQDAQHIRLEGGFPVRILPVQHGVQAVRAAGIVDEHVQGPLPYFPPGPGHEGLHAGGLRNIQRMDEGAAGTGFLGPCGHGFQAVHAPGPHQ